MVGDYVSNTPQQYFSSTGRLVKTDYPEITDPNYQVLPNYQILPTTIEDTYVSNDQSTYRSNLSVIQKMNQLLNAAAKEERGLSKEEIAILSQYNKQISGIASDRQIQQRASSEGSQITDTNVLNTLAPFYERNRIDPNREGKGEELSLLATNAMEEIYKKALTENRSLSAQESYDVSQYQKQIAVAQNFMKTSEAANKEWQIYGLGNDGLASSA